MSPKIIKNLFFKNRFVSAPGTTDMAENLTHEHRFDNVLKKKELSFSIICQVYQFLSNIGFIVKKFNKQV